MGWANGLLKHLSEHQCARVITIVDLDEGTLDYVLHRRAAEGRNLQRCNIPMGFLLDCSAMPYARLPHGCRTGRPAHIHGLLDRIDAMSRGAPSHVSLECCRPAIDSYAMKTGH